MSRARKEGDREEKTEKSNFFFPQRNQNYVEVGFFFYGEGGTLRRVRVHTGAFFFYFLFLFPAKTKRWERQLQILKTSSLKFLIL